MVGPVSAYAGKVHAWLDGLGTKCARWADARSPQEKGRMQHARRDDDSVGYDRVAVYEARADGSLAVE